MPKPDADQSCDNCKFFERDVPDYTRGTDTRRGRIPAYACRRFPTEVAKMPDEWCGEWDQATAAQTPAPESKEATATA